MVARIVSGKSIRGALNYNEKKITEGTAHFLGAENYLKSSELLNYADKLFCLQHRAKLNERVKTNCLHISLNFETSEKLTDKKNQEIARDYMEGIGFKDQPYLVYRHQDAAHPHCHIVTTNIDVKGERISLHNLGRDLSEKVRQEIEIKYGLIKASGRGKEEEIPTPDLNKLKQADYGKDETKKIITQIVNTVVQKYNYSSLAELNAVLARFNVMADRGNEKSAMFTQRGLLYRIIDEKGNQLGVPIKASRIAGKYTLDKLEQLFVQHKPKRKILAASLKSRIDVVLKNAINEKAFETSLAKDKIDIIYRTAKTGQVYGITFIDHGTRAVFNGSELGKRYSAKAIQESFERNASKEHTAHNHKKLISKNPKAINTQKVTGKTLTKDGQLTDRGNTKTTKGEHSLLTDSYLQSVAPTSYLDILLGKTQQEQSAAIPAKRKRKKKRNEKHINL